MPITFMIRRDAAFHRIAENMLNRLISRAAQVGRASLAAPARPVLPQPAGSSGTSLMMVLEIESGATLQHVAQSLHDLGACVEGIPTISGGLLPGSKCGFGLTMHEYPLRVLAKGIKVSWTVGLTMTFHFRPANKMSSLKEIIPFIHLFAEQHPHRFVLSFQYERVYAVRDKKALRVLWPFP